MQIRYTIGIQFSSRADDWIRTSINLFTRQAPFCFEPRRREQARDERLQTRGLAQRPPVSHRLPLACTKHEREESNPVRQLWRLTALPGAHSRAIRLET